MDAPEVIAAIIALGGVVLSVLVSILFHIGTTRYNYNQLFAQTVSQSRNQWLNEMRENISIMLAEASKCRNTYKSREYYIAQNQVLLRMNNSEPLHLMLTQEIKKLESCTVDTFSTYEENILAISEVLLKREWELVKKEAKGGK